MKGILVAGGFGTRLYPITLCISKQLLPVYDKPMLYYPLSTLMLSGIRHILIASHYPELFLYKKLFGDGSQWGIKIEYLKQSKAKGIAATIVTAEKYIDKSPICIMLGDNFLYGHALPSLLQESAKEVVGATIFSYSVSDPQCYGVVVTDESNRPIDVIEKPQEFVSNQAITGLYFFDGQAVKIAKSLKPSERGELEMTDVIRQYLANDQLNIKRLGRGNTWLDMGTQDSMLDAANFMQLLEKRQGFKVGCPEEIAWRLGYINSDQLLRLGEQQKSSSYGQYLLGLLNSNSIHEYV